MIKAVLFDLDGTLLDIDLDRFLSEYFSLLGPAIAALSPDGLDASSAIEAVLAGTQAMSLPHAPRTNQSVFEERFGELSDIDLGSEDARRALERFYRDVFPQLRHNSGAAPCAAQAVHAVRDRGLRAALATNPIFPRAAIEERARWAGLELDWFDHVTSYETATACKPHGSYFMEVAARLGVAAEECVMVGDDPSLDLPARDIGMKTLLVRRSGGEPGCLDTLSTLCDLAEHIG